MPSAIVSMHHVLKVFFPLRVLLFLYRASAARYSFRFSTELPWYGVVCVNELFQQVAVDAERDCFQSHRNLERSSQRESSQTCL